MVCNHNKTAMTTKLNLGIGILVGILSDLKPYAYGQDRPRYTVVAWTPRTLRSMAQQLQVWFTSNSKKLASMRLWTNTMCLTF